MIAAVLILSLLSLLVATDPAPVSAPVQPLPEPPSRPDRKPVGQRPPDTNRLAA